LFKKQKTNKHWVIVGYYLYFQFIYT